MTEQIEVPEEAELPDDEYEGLLPDHKVYHKMGPADLKHGDLTTPHLLEVDIVRQTATTGEQIAIKCPVFISDSREDMMNRINMCYSILQERLEDENRAQQIFNEKAQKARLISEAQKRNLEKLHQDKKKLQRKARQENWTPEVLQGHIKDLNERFEKAQAELATGDLTSAPRSVIGD